ncbi:transcriptional regulator [uncultured Acinetobacter sp.]|uniref:transcriptional regulator n=1 Tax=uncultured Acinetobacter sp. TaxID=165433 RepID=UPI003747F341
MSKRLNTTDTLEAGDQVVLFRTKNCDYRAIPFDSLVQLILDRVPTPVYQAATIQPFNPNGNFTKEIDNNAAGTYLVMNPSTVIAAGTLVLPSINSIVDGQEVLVTSSQQITDLTINANGATVIGAPDAMGATAFFKLKYEELSQTWYRVG